MIARFEVYDIKSASLYVTCFQSVLALLTTDALISKQLSSRCIGALVVLFHRAPWRQTVASRPDPQGRLHSDETSPLIFDLTALQEATSSLPTEHLAWLRIISENFTSLLQFTTDETLLQVLLHARLCGRSVRAILSELGGIESNHPNAGIRSTDAEGVEQGVEAEVARQTTDIGSSLVSALHKLLRAHIFGAEMAKEKMSSLRNISATRADISPIHTRESQERFARTLVKMCSDYSRAECMRLLNSLSMAHGELLDVTSSLYAHVSSANRSSRDGWQLLSCCAEVAPKTARAILQLNLLQEKVDLLLSSEGRSRECAVRF